MKKIVSIVLLSVAICVLLAGCSESDKVNANISMQADQVSVDVKP